MESKKSSILKFSGWNRLNLEMKSSKQSNYENIIRIIKSASTGLRDLQKWSEYAFFLCLPQFLDVSLKCW